MLIKFELTMPNVGSWNGKWTGESNLYAKIINWDKHYGVSKTSKEKVKKILDIGEFYYSFGDGWGANVSVLKIDNKDAIKIRKTSRGFCGYDWMIDSILKYGEIKKKIYE